MPMKRETGKDRWRRVPKDYFKKRDSIQNAKLLFSGLLGILALGYAAWGFKKSEGTSTTDLNGLRANHGELARVHAAWENRCDACHVPFEPIDGRPLLSSKSAAEGRSSDKLCMSCHAGPSHHSAMIASEVKGCAECHRDHQGRDFSLVRLNDAECTTCHESLAAHIASGAKPPNSRIFSDVSKFNAKDHPPFRPEAALFAGGKLQDRGKLKFNHALHMTPGIVKDDKETPYTVERIPIAAERARYQKAGKPGDPVQLDCSSCHVLDASDSKIAPNPAFASVPLPSRNAGRYFLPINYQNQCRACHTQTFDPRPGLKDVEAPHGVQPDQVVAFLKRTYAEKALADDPSVLNRKVTLSPLPGKRPKESTAGKLLDDSVTKATRFLFENRTSCLECHHVQADPQGAPARVEPTKVPEIWFTHAAFDHTAHRGVSCRECHSRSYALEPDGKTRVKDSSSVSTDVLIPAIDNCVQCHAPAHGQGGWFATSSSSPTTGGASFDCTECHRYHNNDNPLQGFGASVRDAEGERTIAEFLTGKGGPASRRPESKAEKR
jgi:hypothetical protein